MIGAKALADNGVGLVLSTHCETILPKYSSFEFILSNICVVSLLGNMVEGSSEVRTCNHLLIFSKGGKDTGH